MNALAVKGLCKRYPAFSLENVSFSVPEGAVMGFIGRNGAGKSTTLKALLGLVHPDAGEVTVLGKSFREEERYIKERIGVVLGGIDFYPKKKVRLLSDVTRRFYGNWQEEKYRHYLNLFGIDQEKRVDQLSTGMRVKYMIALALSHDARLLILDEPTNDLDIRTLTILEDYLDGFDGIVITVSHDRYFLDRVVRRMFAFEDNGKVRQYEGGFSDYQAASAARMEESGSQQKAEETEVFKEKTEKPRTRKLKFTYNEEKEYAVIDEEIENLENKIKELDQEIVRNATDYPKLNALTKEKEETEEKLMEKMERWEYLTELAERIEQERGK